MKKSFTLLLLTLMVSVAFYSTTIINWTFEDATKRAAVYDNITFKYPGYSADSGIAGNINNRIVNTLHGPTYYATQPWPFGSGGINTYAMSSTSWTNGIWSKYWEIDFTTLGYKNLLISSIQRSSSTGPRNFRMQYSLNESMWTDVPGANITVANDYTTGVLNNHALPTACDDQTTVYLRWIMTSNTSVNNSTVDNAGSSRIDEVMITGEPITLPVELSSFTVMLDHQNHPRLTWVTQSETGVVGFHVLRAEDKDLSVAHTVSPLIPATNTAQQQTYTYADADLHTTGLYFYWLQSSDLDGSSAFHGPLSFYFDSSGNGSAPEIPLQNSLGPIYPNPFNPFAFIPFYLAVPSAVEIRIYNPRGQLVRSFDLGVQECGAQRLNWDGKDGQGRDLGSGIYFVTLHAGKDSLRCKALLLK